MTSGYGGVYCALPVQTCFLDLFFLIQPLCPSLRSHHRAIRVQMLGVAQNYKKIYEMYNFDFDPEPGSAQYIVDQRIKRVRAGG